MNSSYLRQALRAGLLVGTFDITAACTQYFIRTGKNPLFVLKYVASGVFGKEALTGGNAMIVWGFVFHYFIATSFACFFFWLYTKIPSLSKHKLLTGLLYGIFIWLVMQLIVVPLSRTAKPPFNALNALTGALILIVCIGIPLSFLAARRKPGAAYKTAAIT